ncbi:MAG: response regulator [Cyanobacteria bacterium P01_A01_bin.114]
MVNPSVTAMPAHDMPAANILVVDDTPANLHLLLKMLSAQGYQVRPVADGALALTAAQLEPPDLILLDIKMPDLDGYEVCKRLKADRRTCDVPVIFLTVLDDTIDIVKGLVLGGVDYITKPFKAGELMARVERQIQLRSLQKQLVEKEQFLRSIYDGVEAAISILDVLDDGQFRIAEVNETFLRMSGLSQASLIGADLKKFLSPEVIRRNHQVCLETGQPVTREEPVELHGQTTWWLSTHTPMSDQHGHIYRLIGTSVNITARKQAEMQLAERTQELSQTLATLKTTQAELVRSAKMAALGNLVAGVAHEINTPLGTAIMSASTLGNATRDMFSDLAKDELKRSAFENYLDIAADCSHLILSNLERAGGLVQSFKQVAVDQTSLQLRTFKLKPYLQEVITNLTPKLKHTPHRITLTGDDTITLYSYPGALAQIITNLIINSLTHAYPTHQPGQLCIAIHQQLATVILSYSDDGVGIPESNLSQIFEPFFTTARHQGGSGLGLHLVYNLVTQKLQGTIAVTSHANIGPQNTGSHNTDSHNTDSHDTERGTTFILTLPSRVSDPHPVG